MTLDDFVLDDSEKIILALRALYQHSGYTRFHMEKFEKYDLYAQNKDFLVSGRIITFTNTDGKLMALKPDVTLSVIKYLRDEPDTLKKLCYNENVYRVSKGSGSFREIMQVGLECIGRVDRDCIGEVLLLAAKSLELVAASYVLEISHLDILMRLLDDALGDTKQRAAALKCIAEKNSAGVAALCREVHAPEEATEALLALMKLYGPAAQVMPALRALCEPKGLGKELDDLDAALAALSDGGFAGRVTLDFSAVSNMNYYNGILFAGFVEGLPDSVLSGGQYDRLMQKMGRTSKAIGFAVYLDRLERIGDTTNGGVVFQHA
ncbi:MAG: ATP phosphoribosyltransferase regulatory subunit [Oscillospiraceae bacterium]|nr:ATP phosphoribosyltransferase regulatory subunit [Oscillospiraceae bacterium]